MSMVSEMQSIGTVVGIGRRSASGASPAVRLTPRIGHSACPASVGTPAVYVIQRAMDACMQGLVRLTFKVNKIWALDEQKTY